MKKLLTLLFFFPLMAFAVSPSPTDFGGSGTTTPSGIMYGDNGATHHLNTLIIGSGLTLSGGALSSSGTAASSTLLTDSNTFSGLDKFTNASSNFSGTWQTFSPSHFLTSYDAWTHPASGQSATTSQLNMTGFLSSASSTISSTLFISTLSSGLLASNGGLLYGGISTTTATCSGTVSCSQFTILGSSPITLTGSGTSIVYPVSTSTAETQGQLAYWTTSGATPERLASVATSSASCSGGTTCSAFTVVGSVSPTISSFSYLFPSNATTSSLTFGGLLSTASSTFSSTLFTSGLVTINGGFLDTASSTITAVFDLTPATVSEHMYKTFTYATSTSWTGTTTIFLGTTFVKENWNQAICRTDIGTLTVLFYNGLTLMNPILATTASSTQSFTLANTIPASNNRKVDIGNPASSPTQITCSLDIIQNK